MCFARIPYYFLQILQSRGVLYRMKETEVMDNPRRDDRYPGIHPYRTLAMSEHIHFFMDVIESQPSQYAPKEQARQWCGGGRCPTCMEEIGRHR